MPILLALIFELDFAKQKPINIKQEIFFSSEKCFKNE
jgi:hypothetical protein